MEYSDIEENNEIYTKEDVIWSKICNVIGYISVVLVVGIIITLVIHYQ